jgi:hypothetical protein
MEFYNVNFMKRCHCPNCNCLYIIIDNEIISCPGCEIASITNLTQKNYEDDAEKEIVQFQF